MYRWSLFWFSSICELQSFNTHQVFVPLHYFACGLSITQKLWPTDIYMYHVRSKQIRRGKDRKLVYVLYVWMYLEVGVATYKMSAFILVCFSNYLPGPSYCMLLKVFCFRVACEPQSKTHSSIFLICIFVLISSITLNYNHLKASRPVTSK